MSNKTDLIDDDGKSKKSKDDNSSNPKNNKDTSSSNGDDKSSVDSKDGNKNGFGIYVSKEIRETQVTNAVSKISSIIPVREKLVKLQRKMVEGKNVIAEGRDIGTVVFPNANLKIYLDANEEVRAKRRFKSI